MHWNLSLTVLLTMPLAVRADLPKDQAVTATLVAKKTTYTLDLGGMTTADYKKMLKDAEKTGKYPAAPAVELTLELKNTSGKDVKIWIGGDPVTLMLELKGPGAISVDAQRIFTKIYYGPKEIDLASGKTHEIKITALQYGYRGVAKRAYWTEAGDYSLTATFNTALNPAPEGAKADGKGFGRVALTSAPLKIKVEPK